MAKHQPLNNADVFIPPPLDQSPSQVHFGFHLLLSCCCQRFQSYVSDVINPKGALHQTQIHTCKHIRDALRGCLWRRLKVEENLKTLRFLLARYDPAKFGWLTSTYCRHGASNTNHNQRMMNLVYDFSLSTVAPYFRHCWIHQPNWQPLLKRPWS